MSKFILIKNIKCGSYDNENFISEFEYSDMNSLAEIIIQHGKWTPSKSKEELPAISLTTFNKRIQSSCAKPTNLLGLDFDHESNKIEYVLDFFREYSYFFYTSYSHTKEHHKFRVIIELDCEIHDNKEANMVSNIIKRRLQKQGTEIDGVCKDISRRFFIPSLDKSGNMPEMECNVGHQYPIEQDLKKEIAKEISRARAQEQLDALRMDKKRYTKYNSKVEEWKEKAKDKFIKDRSHNSLIKLIRSLRRLEESKEDIISWVVMNYPSTGEDRRQEAEKVYHWFDGKIA